MTRKDFVALAQALNTVKPDAAEYTWKEQIPAGRAWLDCVTEIMLLLATDNPRFDRERFIKACQGEKS